jgi:hypothetical protein
MAKRRRKSRRAASPAQKRARARFKAAAKICKHRRSGKYITCMRKQLRK